jgi:predicted RNA-binding protein with PUA-like domain
MACWLLKTEPSTYGYADLEREGRATWDGVTNALALKHLREAASGDEAFIYHTGGERSVVGLARLASAPYPDPKAGDPRRVVVDLVPVRRLPAAVSLAEIKADPAFRELALVRNARLSVVPVPAPLRDRLFALGGLA